MQPEERDDDTLVWAHTPIAELNFATGFVACKGSLAARLIAEDKVQDTTVGAHHFKAIVAAAPDAQATYATKDVKASRKRADAA